MTRRRQQLVLLDREISLIKGLIVHTELNDQMIVAIFSHLSRTINHREISYIRQGRGRYSGQTAADKSDVVAFLSQYKRFERLAQAHGIVPQEGHFQLVQKAQEAMRSAVMIFNNPNINWKSEIFIVNAVIAWTYLMHAYYLKEGIEYIYKKGGEAVLTDDGRPKHWELTKCISTGVCPLSKPVKSNLDYLISIRNEIEHRLSDNVDKYLEPKLQACALNFEQWMCKWFGEACSIAHELGFAIQFAEISIKSQKEVVGDKGLPSVIANANAAIEKNMSLDDFNDPSYSYRVYVVPRTINNKKKADQAVIFAEQGSDVELAVRDIERPKYKAAQIVQKMVEEGFTDFNMHGKRGFVRLWQGMDARNLSKGLGVEIAGSWYWYEAMMTAVREQLSAERLE